jgi:hypothetical protein
MPGLKDFSLANQSITLQIPFATIMKQVYQAFDGSIFDSEGDCIDHEIALRSKGEMVMDWLISGLNAELSTIDMTDPEGAESYLESSETLKWLHQIKNSASTDKFIDLSEEVESLTYRWEDDPRSLEAARLTLASTEPLDNESLPFLRRAIGLLSKSHARTKIVVGRPVFPSINEDGLWDRFSDRVYYLEDLDPDPKENQSSGIEDMKTEWINAFDDGEYCKSCRHWFVDDPATDKDHGLNSGVCKRNPPVDGEFPSTKPWETCGEWDC